MKGKKIKQLEQEIRNLKEENNALYKMWNEEMELSHRLLRENQHLLQVLESLKGE